MPSGIGERLLLVYDTSVEGNALSQLHALNSAHQQVNNTYSQGARAQATLGRTAANASILQSKAMQSAAQSTFRYTFYAMMALRAGQALATKVFAKGLITQAESYEAVWTRVAATLQVSSNRLAQMQAVAFDMGRSMPFLQAEIGNAILEMARAGMALDDIQASIKDVGKLAMIAQVDLSEAGTFTVQMLKAYNIEAREAAQVTNLLAYYQDKSVYTTKQLMDILGGVGGAAYAYGQNLAQVLQLATAFSMRGTPAGEADTLIRQLYMNVAKPQVYEAMKFGLEQLGLPTIYDEYGAISNLGEAFLGFSKFLKQTLDETMPGEERAEMAANINELIYSLFGVRSSRAFFQLAGTEESTFKELYTTYEGMVKKAEEYASGYIETLRTGYQYAKKMAQVSQQTFATQLGTPMLPILKPLHEARAQLFSFGSELLATDSEVGKLIPMVLFLTSATVGLAGAAAVAAGTYMILKVRLGDFGEALRQQGMVEVLRGKGYFGGVGSGIVPSTAGVSMAYFRSLAMTPIRMFAGAAMIGGAAYLAYKKNFLGARTFGDRMVAWWNANMRGSETIGTRLAKKVKEYATLTTDKSGKTTGRGFAYFVKGFKDIFAENGLLAQALQVLKPVGIGFKWVFEHAILAPLKLIGRTVGLFFGWLIKWSVGGGDAEKGVERLGNAIGALLALLIADRTVSAIMNLSKALWRLILYATIGPKIEGGGRGFGAARLVGRMIHAPAISRVASGAALRARSAYYTVRAPGVAARAIAGAGAMPLVRGPGGRFLSREESFYANLGAVKANLPRGGAYGGTLDTYQRIAKAETGFIAARTGRGVVAAATREIDAKVLESQIWMRKITSVPRNMAAAVTRSADAGYLYRVGHPIATMQAAMATRRMAATGVQTGALAAGTTSTAVGGAIGRTAGGVSMGSAMAAVLPWILGALAVTGLVAMIVSAFRGGGGGGTTYQANVTINGNVGQSPEQITAAVQQGLQAAKRQTEIAQVETAARQGYLQAEMVGA